VINIKRYPKLFKAFFYLGMVFINNSLGRSAFFFALMVMAAPCSSDPQTYNYILFFEPQVPYKNIGGQVSAGKVAYMERPVSIRQCRSNRISFIFVEL
jgi:hypothetical protein